MLMEVPPDPVIRSTDVSEDESAMLAAGVGTSELARDLSRRDDLQKYEYLGRRPSLSEEPGAAMPTQQDLIDAENEAMDLDGEDAVVEENSDAVEELHASSGSEREFRPGNEEQKRKVCRCNVNSDCQSTDWFLCWQMQLVWSGFYSRSNKAGLAPGMQHCKDVLKKVLKHPHVSFLWQAFCFLHVRRLGRFANQLNGRLLA